MSPALSSSQMDKLLLLAKKGNFFNFPKKLFSTSNYYLNRSNEPLAAGADTEKLCKDLKSKSNCGNNQHGVNTEK